MRVATVRWKETLMRMEMRVRGLKAGWKMEICCLTGGNGV